VSAGDGDKDNKEACSIYSNLVTEFAAYDSGAASLQGSMVTAVVLAAVAAKLQWA